MRGFQPAGRASHVQSYADGGVVGFLKRAVGLAPKLYPSALDEQRQAQQRAQQQSKQPQEPPPQPSGVGALPRDYLRNPGAVLKRREQDAGLKDGGRVRPRGFVSGPGTQTSDSIPARLSDGEYVLPADTVQAVGVDRLDALRDATHTPARGVSAQRDGEFFLAGGGFMPGVRAVFNSSGDEISNLARQGRYGAAAGETARATLAYVPAALDDVVGGAIRAVGPGVVDAGKQFLGLNGGAAPQPSAQSGNQASVNGAPAATGTQGVAPLASAEETQRRARAIRGEGQPPSGEVAQTQPGSQIMPVVYSHGNGQYSDNPAGMGFSPGFTGQPSAQNMAAADTLAVQSQQDAPARIAAQAQAAAPQAASVQAPIVHSSLNDWQMRNELRNAEVSANSITNNGGRFDRHGRGVVSPAMLQYQSLLKSDQALRSGQPTADIAAMRENAGLQRTGMQEAGANQRSADRLASDSQRLGLDTLAKGFDIRNAQRKEGILQRYDAANTDEERAALVKQFPDVFGKQDGSWKLQVTPATKNMDGSTSEGSVIRYNDRTGQVERVNLDGQQQSAPADKAQRKVGVTYMMPNGQLGRWTEKGWLPVA